jgi:hypothetical protein
MKEKSSRSDLHTLIPHAENMVYDNIRHNDLALGDTFELLHAACNAVRKGNNGMNEDGLFSKLSVMTLCKTQAIPFYYPPAETETEKEEVSRMQHETQEILTKRLSKSKKGNESQKYFALWLLQETVPNPILIPWGILRLYDASQKHKKNKQSNIFLLLEDKRQKDPLIDTLLHSFQQHLHKKRHKEISPL